VSMTHVGTHNASGISTCTPQILPVLFFLKTQVPNNRLVSIEFASEQKAGTSVLYNLIMLDSTDKRLL
jgi:hypothetical protein